MVVEAHFVGSMEPNSKSDYFSTNDTHLSICLNCKSRSLPCSKVLNGSCHFCSISNIKCNFEAPKKVKYTYAIAKREAASSHQSGGYLGLFRRDQSWPKQTSQLTPHSPNLRHRLFPAKCSPNLESAYSDRFQKFINHSFTPYPTLPKTIIDPIELDDGAPGNYTSKKPVPRRFNPPNLIHRMELSKTIQQNASILEWHVGIFLDRTTRDLVEIMFRRMRDPKFTNDLAKKLQGYLTEPINETTVVLLSCMAALGALLLYCGPLKTDKCPFIYHTSYTYGVVPSQVYKAALSHFMNCQGCCPSDLTKLHLSYMLLKRVQPYLNSTKPIILSAEHPLSKFTHL